MVLVPPSISKHTSLRPTGWRLLTFVSGYLVLAGAIGMARMEVQAQKDAAPPAAQKLITPGR